MNSRNLQSVLSCGSRISIIIPSYNSALVLPDALRSVLCQTRPADEIVVVDDGSDDGTEEACRRHAPQARYVRQHNSGASSARNTGAATATGEWLAFLDADDVWDSRKLELQCRAHAQRPEADFSVTAAWAWSPRGRDYHLYRWEGSLDPRDIQRELLVRNPLSGLCSSLMIRRAAFEAVDGFAAGRACEDRRIAIALLDRFQCLLLSQPLIRQQPGPAHWTDPKRHGAEMLRFIEDHAEYYKRLDLSGRLRRRALAQVHDRTGMHHLENGEFVLARRELRRAARLWPLLPNPWRVHVNSLLGRLKPG